MARSFDDKKKEIFNYLSKYASKNNFLELTEDKLFNKFRGIIKEEEIKEIISKLEEEGSLNRNNLNYDIIYPKDNEDKILRMFSNKIKRDILWIYIIITFIWMYFINNFQIIPDFILERMVGEGEKTNGQIFNIGFLVSLFVIFFIF